MENMIARKGTVRLYLEVRFDLPFSHEEPLTIKEIVKKLIDEHGLYELVAAQRGEFADNVHAVLVDVERSGGNETVLFEKPSEIEELVYGGRHASCA